MICEHAVQVEISKARPGIEHSSTDSPNLILKPVPTAVKIKCGIAKTHLYRGFALVTKNKLHEITKSMKSKNVKSKNVKTEKRLIPKK